MVFSKKTLFPRAYRRHRSVSFLAAWFRHASGARPAGVVRQPRFAFKSDTTSPVPQECMAAEHVPHSRCGRVVPRRRLRVSRNAGGDFFQNLERNFLRLAVMRQIALKFAVQLDRVTRVELRAQNHVAQADRVRQQPRPLSTHRAPIWHHSDSSFLLAISTRHDSTAKEP